MKFRTADARLLSHILLTKYGHSKSSHPTFSPYCVALTPSHQMGAMGLCLPLEHTRTFTAALTDKVWQKWCYQKMLWPPPFSLGSWNSATLLRRSPRSYTWSDNMEKIDVVSFPAFGPAGVTAESHPASRHVSEGILQWFQSHLSHHLQQLRLPRWGLKHCGAKTSLFLTTEILGAWLNCCFTALHLGMVCYGARVNEIASESLRPMSRSCLQTWLWPETSYRLPHFLISTAVNRRRRARPAPGMALRTRGNYVFQALSRVPEPEKELKEAAE